MEETHLCYKILQKIYKKIKSINKFWLNANFSTILNNDATKMQFVSCTQTAAVNFCTTSDARAPHLPQLKPAAHASTHTQSPPANDRARAPPSSSVTDTARGRDGDSRRARSPRNASEGNLAQWGKNRLQKWQHLCVCTREGRWRMKQPRLYINHQKSSENPSLSNANKMGL